MPTPTLWFCEQCGVLGAVIDDVPRGAVGPFAYDVMSTVYAIGDGHSTASPTCSQPRDRIRVVNLDAITKTGELLRCSHGKRA